MNNITVTCGDIHTSLGFLYVVSFAVVSQSLDDCEQSWFSEYGLKIADPSVPETLIDPVISVSTDRLVTSRCVNLNHEIICDSAKSLHYSHVSMFRVRNETAATPDVPNEVTPSLLLSEYWWLFIIIFIILFIGFMLCKRTFRCFPKVAQSVCQRNDSENGDLESGDQTKVRSDAPDSLNLISSAVQCPEDDHDSRVILLLTQTRG
ncbi:uncharacterized protein LOC120475449 [Pimephales promelas]|uniref:uncharacterized protein LOC120475449 n=1 Tax=Pimephales promelas TaxID=90988 RepID=UPI0019557A0A|nr:uncharacterized protein LOC120475449 [Pimephales promelas]